MQSVRDFFITVFSPLARRMPNTNPNTLTTVSIAVGIAAGIAFWLATIDTRWFFAAALLIGISGAADCLDGVVARLYGRESRGGDFYDHAGDRFVEVAILLGLAFAPGATTTLGLVVIVLTLLHSYLGTQLEATFGRREYGGPGKAEQFVALVSFSALLGFVPDGLVGLGADALSFVDVFFVVLGLFTVAGMVRRLRNGFRYATETPAPGRSPNDHR